MTEGWDRYHVGAAIHAATKSKAPKTKVGCALVGPDNEPLSTGFNGFARGIREYDESEPWKLDAARWTRPTKHSYMVHAEVNAIFNAARRGVALMGCTAYLNFAPCCCEGCANALIQIGAVAVVGPDIPFPGAGDGEMYNTSTGLSLLREAGVELRTIAWP